MSGGGCNCGCSGGHEPGCPQYEAMIGTYISLRDGDACGTSAANAAVLDIKCSLGIDLAGIVAEVTLIEFDNQLRADAVLPADALAAIRAPFTESGGVWVDPPVLQPLGALRCGQGGESP